MTSAVLLAWLLCGVPAEEFDTAVVCPQEFRAALEPWAEFRRGQGHQLTFVSNLHSPQQLRDEVRRLAAGGKLKYLVLVGDADPRMVTEPAVRRRSIPAHYAKAEVNVQFGSSPEIATDNWYADLDDDRVPDVAVGRITCDSASELTLVVEKILAYERSADFGSWRRQVHFVAGLGGFGAVADTVLEAAAKSLISDGVPSAYCTTMTYGSWQSPYCPDPRMFRDVTLSRLNEGSLFWVYLGHGQQRSVDEVRVPGGRFPILSTDDTIELACQHGAPIACFLACYSGAYDLPRDCLAEEMLVTEGGPVAILCGSRVTMPYAMSILGQELMTGFFADRRPTLGAVMHAAKRNTTLRSRDDAECRQFDAVATMLMPMAADLDAQRREHLYLFNLLGDPLLRMRHPQPVDVAAPQQVTAGETLTVRGQSPLGGQAVIELVVRRDRLTFVQPDRDVWDRTTTGHGERQETYARANDPRLTSIERTLPAGPFEFELPVPAAAKGDCHVRVYVAGNDGFGLGSSDVKVVAAKRTP